MNTTSFATTAIVLSLVGCDRRAGAPASPVSADSSAEAASSAPAKATASAASSGSVVPQDAAIQSAEHSHDGGESRPRASAGSCAAAGCETLATEQEDPGGLALDSAYLYWTTADSADAGRPSARGRGDIRRTPRRGGPVETLASNVDIRTALGLDVAARSGAVYWTERSAVWELAGSGSPPRPFEVAQDGPVALALDDQHAYWANYEGPVDESTDFAWGSIVSKSLSKGSTRVTLAAKNLYHPISLRVDRGQLYWITAGARALTNSIHTMPSGGGEDRVLASSGFPEEAWSQLVIDGDYLYWRADAPFPPNPAGVYRIRLEKQPSTSELSPQLVDAGRLLAFTVHASNLFVSRCSGDATDACELTVRPTELTEAGPAGRVLYRGRAEELIADGAYLFWKDAKSESLFRWTTSQASETPVSPTGSSHPTGPH
jgi:hypothetical protein